MVSFGKLFKVVPVKLFRVNRGKDKIRLRDLTARKRDIYDVVSVAGKVLPRALSSPPGNGKI